MKQEIIEDFKSESGGLFYTSRGLFAIVIESNSKIKVPTFMVVDADTMGKKFRCRIMIKEAKYYGKRNDKLQQEEVMSLVKHLDYSGYEKVYSKWNMILDGWNFGNKNKVRKIKRPEYEKLMHLKGVR